MSPRNPEWSSTEGPDDGTAALDKDLPHQVGAVINNGEAKAVDELSDSSSQGRWSLPGSKTGQGSGGGLKERLHILTIGHIWENKDVAICAPQADEAGYYDSHMDMDVCFLGYIYLPESFRRHLEHIRSVRKLYNLKSTIPMKLLLDFNLSKDILDFITLFLDNSSLCHASTTLFLFAFTFLLNLIIPLPVGPTSCIMGHTASTSFRNQSALPIL